ncbi:MAG: PTS glucitol/sorbitol transporter subunit IIC [Bilifractor sp.]|jgi:PTS system glucitol/sorbitol-specific IIC component
MDIIVSIAKGFMNLFTLGGEQFVSWVSDIIPTVLMLLILMNAIIALAGQESVNKIAAVCNKNPVLRYMVLPFISAFMLGNPMALSIGKFMPEFYKPAYYASATYHCHTNSGLFPHINASELFIWLGIADGITTLGLDTTPLAVRYMLVGLIANFISGWSTELTTKFVEKQQNIRLDRHLKTTQAA